MARLNKNTYLLKVIIKLRGDPQLRFTRSTLRMMIKCGCRGCQIFLHYFTQFKYFCRHRPQLYQLLYYAVDSIIKMLADLNRTNITEVKPGQDVFLSISAFLAEIGTSHQVFLTDELNYVLVFSYHSWYYHKTTFTKIVAHCYIFQETWPVIHSFV